MNALLLWVALAAAQTSTAPTSTPPAAATEAAATEAAATEAAPTSGTAEQACADPTPALLERLRAQEDRPAMLCLAQRDDAGPALLQSLSAAGPGETRLTRALALWRMQRLDERIPDDEARALSASDRRLLRDAVQARRGRASPAPEHAEIFGWFSWYKPDARYMANRLTALDRENMGALDKPPPKPPAAPPAAAAMEEAQTEAPAPPAQGFCGCATAPSGLSLAGLVSGLLGLAALRRRA